MRAPCAGRPRCVSWRFISLLMAALLVISGLGIAIGVTQFGRSRRNPANYSLVILPAIQEPVTLPAEAAALADDAEVVGVKENGQVRAYALSAFYHPAVYHVVNDVVGGKPITVTYCDMTNCVAVFTGPDAGKPLDMAAGGWTGQSVGGRMEGAMLLRVGSTWYRQDTKEPISPSGAAPFPYTETEFVRTTWKQWHEQHPDTDVYVGVNGAPAEPNGLEVTPAPMK